MDAIQNLDLNIKPIPITSLLEGITNFSMDIYVLQKNYFCDTVKLLDENHMFIFYINQ